MGKYPFPIVFFCYFNMADQWYYGWGNKKFGPYSPTQFKELVEQGKIQPTDMIWKEGIEQGVLASNVENLFPNLRDNILKENEPSASHQPSQINTPEIGEEQPPEIEPGELMLMGIPEPNDSADLVSPASAHAADENLNKPGIQKQSAKKGRAVGVKGAVIISQDGERVQYRKKCIKCGYEDASKSTLPIRNGITRGRFFCPKCRRAGEVIIQGIM
ncbi:MAG TPA: DUF4339 domain-containing protein [Gemmataceae bacterium]|nr:DUF4339 domain-containing protein [Gemmataceae bacterium]